MKTSLFGGFYLKKSWTVVSILLLSLSLAACQKEEAKNTDEKPTETEVIVENKTFSTEEFLKKIKEANMELNSFSTDTTISTKTKVGEKEETMPLKISMKATLEPLRIQQSIDMDLRESGFGRIKGDSYMQDGLMYIQHPESGAWMKTNIANFEETMKQSLNPSPLEQVEWVKQNAGLFTIKEENEAYVLTFNGKKEDIQEWVDSQLEVLLKENTLPISSEKTWKYESLHYEIVLDKQTFFPVSLQMTAELLATLEGEEVITTLELQTVYKDINAVSEITLPEEAQNAENAPQ